MYFEKITSLQQYMPDLLSINGYVSNTPTYNALLSILMVLILLMSSVIVLLLDGDTILVY